MGDWGLAKLKEVLARGPEPHLMTGEQYEAFVKSGH